MVSNLYHYTSLDALYGIVTSQKLRLFSANNMNDADEISDKAELLEHALMHISTVDPEKYSTICKKTIETVQKIKGIGYYRPGFIESAYSCSFVDDGDSLTHWSMYGLSGEGVAIGFNKKILQNYLEQTYNIYHIPCIYLTSIMYGSIEDEIRALLDNYINYNLNHSGFAISMSAMLSILGRYKNQLFYPENETRLLLRILNETMMRRFKKEYLKMEEKQGLIGIKTCVLRGVIRTFYELILTPIWNLNNDEGIISEIIVGPKSGQNISDLRVFFDENGLEHVYIYDSKIPLK